MPRECRPRLKSISHERTMVFTIHVYYVPASKLESQRLWHTAEIFAPLANGSCWLQDAVRLLRDESRGCVVSGETRNTAVTFHSKKLRPVVTNHSLAGTETSGQHGKLNPESGSNLGVRQLVVAQCAKYISISIHCPRILDLRSIIKPRACGQFSNNLRRSSSKSLGLFAW